MVIDLTDFGFQENPLAVEFLKEEMNVHRLHCKNGHTRHQSISTKQTFAEHLWLGHYMAVAELFTELGRLAFKDLR